MTEPFPERLLAGIERTGLPLAVGLDPHPDLLPARFARGPDLVGFGRAVLEALAGRVPVVKIQVAFYERCGPAGWAALLATARLARELGYLTIADAKRGDIASTAAAYAAAFFPAFDALTVNPYLGEDGVRPFVTAARKSGGGVFVLVRTSNPSAAEFQDLDAGGEPLHRRIARRVAAWSAENRGPSGYGDVAAVVGATARGHIAALRAEMPGVWFLLPGLGAQGGCPADVAPAFDAAGRGALLTASRSIVFPGGEDWTGGMRQAVDRVRSELAGRA